MIWHYLYEFLINKEIDNPEELIRIMAYVERSAALDTVSFILDLVSEAKKKGLGLDDIESAISDLYSSLEAEKQLLVNKDPVLSLADEILERAERIKKSKEENKQ